MGCCEPTGFTYQLLYSLKGENSESTFLFNAVRFSKELSCVDGARTLPGCRSGKSNMWKKINI
jgi:hypothetical protein